MNTAKTTVESVKKELRSSCVGPFLNVEIIDPKEITQDEMIPCILRIPSSVDLHDHPLVSSLSIILQTKASCFPPFLLLRDVFSNPKTSLTFDVIDATAAPGNKTTFLGDIMRNQYTPQIHLTHSGTVYAFDRDRKRYELLKDRCERYGSGNVRDPPRRET